MERLRWIKESVPRPELQWLVAISEYSNSVNRTSGFSEENRNLGFVM